MMTEQEFLAQLARRLGRQAPLQGPVGWDPGPSLTPPLPAREVDQLWARFAGELTKLGGVAFRAATREEAREYVVQVAADAAAAGGAPDGAAPALVLAWDDPTPAQLQLAPALAARGLELALWNPGAGSGSGPATGPAPTPDAAGPEVHKALAARAVVGLTGVDLAAVETGTLILKTAPGRGRLVSLLPPVHLALLRPAQLLPSVAECFRQLAAEGTLPSSVVLITGPSRSADIENDLSIGVHGPASVHVVLLPE